MRSPSPNLPLVARIARIEHHVAEAPYVRAVRETASGHSVWREDLRFFAIAYVAGLIIFLSWLA